MAKKPVKTERILTIVDGVKTYVDNPVQVPPKTRRNRSVHVLENQGNGSGGELLNRDD